MFTSASLWSKCYSFVNDVEKYKLKSKDSEINIAQLYLSRVSKDFSIGNIKNTGLCRYVYAFSVDYDSSDVDDISDIRKCLMKKQDIR